MKGIKILLFAFIMGFIGLVNVNAEVCSYNYSEGGYSYTFNVNILDSGVSFGFNGITAKYKKIQNDGNKLKVENSSSTAVIKLSKNDFVNSDGNVDCSKVRSLYIDANVTTNSEWEIYNISKGSGSSISSSVIKEYPSDYFYSRNVSFSLANSDSNDDEGGFTQGGSATEGSGVGRDEVVSGDWDVNTFCNGPVQGVFTTIGWVFFILKIVVPIILIVMGSIDLAKVLLSNKNDELQKQVGILVKRVILGILIFFIPTILSFVVELIGGDDIYDENSGTFGRCTYCMLNPSECRKLAE